MEKYEHNIQESVVIFLPYYILFSRRWLYETFHKFIEPCLTTNKDILLDIYKNAKKQEMLPRPLMLNRIEIKANRNSGWRFICLHHDMIINFAFYRIIKVLSTLPLLISVKLMAIFINIRRKFRWFIRSSMQKMLLWKIGYLSMNNDVFYIVRNFFNEVYCWAPGEKGRKDYKDHLWLT